MRCDRKTMRLYAVTDRAWVGQGTLGDQVEQALRGGVTCVQLREKSLGVPAILVEAEEIGALCRSYGVPFLINDRVEIALQCGADGVHVGQKDRAAREVRRLLGPNRILGVSARTVEQAVQAERDGADYLGVGAVFSTSTKADAMPVSYETLQAICRAVSIPVVAIGGIQREIFCPWPEAAWMVWPWSPPFLPRRMWKRPAGSFGRFRRQWSGHRWAVGSGRRQKYEDSTYHCRFRLQRWGRHSGRYQDHCRPTHVCHERHYGPHRPEYHRRIRGTGDFSGFCGQTAGLHFHRHPPGQRQNWHAVRGGDHPSCGGKAPAVWGQKRGGRFCDGVHQRNQSPFGGRAQGPLGGATASEYAW